MLSFLTMTDDILVAYTMQLSRKEEWGAITRMGASARLAWRPLIEIAMPPARYDILPMKHISGFSDLERANGRRGYSRYAPATTWPKVTDVWPVLRK
ncbi:unnamed protein product, partial [Iphiclides podalirius]